MDAGAQSFGAVGALAWARLQTDDAAGARDAASRWDDLISEVRTPPGQAHLYSRFTHTDRARVALALGDVDLAVQVLDAVGEPIARIGDPRRGRVCTTRRRRAQRHGDLAGAAALLAAGLEIAGSDGFVALRMALAR